MRTASSWRMWTAQPASISYKETAENILQIEIPYSLLPSLIAAQGDEPPLATLSGAGKIPA